LGRIILFSAAGNLNALIISSVLKSKRTVSPEIVGAARAGPAGPICDFKVGDIVEPSSQAAGIGSLESRAGMN
jgi:hypothetical protein